MRACFTLKFNLEHSNSLTDHKHYISVSSMVKVISLEISLNLASSEKGLRTFYEHSIGWNSS